MSDPRGEGRTEKWWTVVSALSNGHYKIHGPHLDEGVDLVPASLLAQERKDRDIATRAAEAMQKQRDEAEKRAAQNEDARAHAFKMYRQAVAARDEALARVEAKLVQEHRRRNEANDRADEALARAQSDREERDIAFEEIGIAEDKAEELRIQRDNAGELLTQAEAALEERTRALEKIVDIGERPLSNVEDWPRRVLSIARAALQSERSTDG